MFVSIDRDGDRAAILRCDECMLYRVKCFAEEQVVDGWGSEGGDTTPIGRLVVEFHGLKGDTCDIQGFKLLTTQTAKVSAGETEFTVYSPKGASLVNAKFEGVAGSACTSIEFGPADCTPVEEVEPCVGDDVSDVLRDAYHRLMKSRVKQRVKFNGALVELTPAELTSQGVGIKPTGGASTVMRQVPPDAE